MIEPDIYCKVSGMTMRCISFFNDEKKKLPVVVEIGCADGQGTMRFAGFTRKTICIDPMVEGRPDIDSRKKIELKPDSAKLELFTRRTQDFPVHLIQGCSLWEETFSSLKNILNGELIDILVIDGCHHPFEAVWDDFEKYFPLVSPGGYIVFDDLYEECIQSAFDKAKEKYKLQEVSNWSVKLPHILQHCAALKVNF
jgi:cephalosporin hydroxylase